MKKQWLLAIGVGVLAACGTTTGSGGNPPPPPPPPPPLSNPPGDAGFNIVDNAFVDPDGNRNGDARITIDAGQVAGWIHDGINLHTVVFSSRPSGAVTQDSDNLTNGETFLQTLTTPGTYEFFCSIHPATMRDVTIVVN
ncbi:MAG: plastocyanin/azurin family copper-binding protein [Gemmatimonadota bacterium]|nr:plastocyanin/azurin family copper-binding protein [Gemmatimonadota bacterium]